MWADYAFPCQRYGHRPSSLVEQQNFVYRQAREMGPIDMMQYIWDDQAAKFHKRLEKAAKGMGPLSDSYNVQVSYSI